VQNSETKGIQGMQAVSNLPISAWLPLADLRGGKTAAGCHGEPSAEKLQALSPFLVLTVTGQR